MKATQKTDGNVVRCHQCKNPIPSIPSWLASVDVRFECEECRQKAMGRPATLDYEPLATDELAEPEASSLLEDTLGEEGLEDAEPEIDLEEIELEEEDLPTEEALE